MNKIIGSAFGRIKAAFKESIPYVAFLAILGLVGYFSWINHNELERDLFRQAKNNLYTTALIEAQSIKSYSSEGFSEARIGDLLKDVNNLEKTYAFIIKNNADIVYYPYEGYVNKNILSLTKDNISSSEWLKLNAMVEELREGKQGTGLLTFYSAAKSPRIVKVLMAYAPVHIGLSRYSIIFVMEYSIIERLVHRNAVLNLIFMGFACLTIIIFGLIFYRIHREKDKLALREMTLSIINKQLHSEIDERKCTP